ncbi:MAG: hypothetical protein QOE92_2198, partial [Chloroflexota bacterium]|nr:hypothetical protein [Chloroflexota bacterium]
AWIIIVGLPAAVVGSGFVGSLVQVGWAMACRDLCLRAGLAPAPDGERRVWTPPPMMLPA